MQSCKLLLLFVLTNNLLHIYLIYDNNIKTLTQYSLQLKNRKIILLTLKSIFTIVVLMF